MEGVVLVQSGRGYLLLHCLWAGDGVGSRAARQQGRGSHM